MESLHGALDLVKVVAVDGDHIEVEGAQLIFQRGAVHDSLGGAIDLQMVAVQHHAQVRKAVVGGKHKGLPAFALFHLAIAQNGVNVHGRAGVLCAQRHAAGGGDALTQTAGGHIHAGHTVHVGVTLQAAADLTQGLELFHREEAPLCQRCVQRRGGMTLGQHQTVAVGHPGLGRVDVQFLKVQIRQHVCDAQTAARMTTACTVGPFDHAHADVAGVLFQGKFFSICHDGPPV